MSGALAAIGIGAGVGSMLGGMFGANSSAAASKEIAQMQIDWERERAKNAHQWEVADLQAAGLNKVLTANGQGAATGGINPPMPDTSGYQQAGNAIATGANTAMQLQQNSINQQNADTAQTAAKAQATLQLAQAGEISAQWMPGGIKAQELNKLKKEIENLQSQTHANTVTAKYTATKTVESMTNIAREEIETAIRNKDLKYYEIGAIMNYVGKYVMPMVMMLNGKGIADKALAGLMRKETQTAIKHFKGGTVPRRGAYIEDINPFYHAKKNPYQGKL